MVVVLKAPRTWKNMLQALSKRQAQARLTTWLAWVAASRSNENETKKKVKWTAAKSGLVLLLLEKRQMGHDHDKERMGKVGEQLVQSVQTYHRPLLSDGHLRLVIGAIWSWHFGKVAESSFPL